MTLPAEPCRVPEVRRFVGVQLDLWGVADDDLHSAVLVVSELVGNAAVHGRASMCVSLRLDARRLNLEVIDWGTPPDLPPSATRRADECGDEHGRGLSIVEHLAEWFECREAADSHTVRVVLCVSGRNSGCPDEHLLG
ncbi:ATP-binding protein [Streptomyces sp. PRKS01-29]|nr:ATP-binding protein [Streptomyces sabulosicollis]MBI0293487.1 ATP-binding protein [Streptomyces sabulosicollis]